MAHGVIVGSSAYNLQHDLPINDIDIIVPPAHWPTATMLMTQQEVSLTSFGGFRFTCKDGTKVDIWMEELGNHLMRELAAPYFIIPKVNKVFGLIKQ